MFIFVSFSSLTKLFQSFSLPFITIGVTFCLAKNFCFGLLTILIWTSFLLLFFLFQSTVSYDFLIVILSPFDLDKSNFFSCPSIVKGLPLIGCVVSFQFLLAYSAGYVISSFCSKFISSGENLFFSLPL